MVPTVNAVLGASLQHTEPRLAQRDILTIGLADKFIEHRILEDCPPLAEVVGLAADANVVSIDPVRRHLRRRLGVIGADLEPVVDVIGQGRTPGEQRTSEK